MDYTLIPNPRSWSIVWQVVVVLGPLAIMIVGMFMSILIAWGRDLERMLGALQSSVWLDTQKRMWGNERLFLAGCCLAPLVEFSPCREFI